MGKTRVWSTGCSAPRRETPLPAKKSRKSGMNTSSIFRFLTGPGAIRKMRKIPPALSCTLGFQKEHPSSTFTTVLKCELPSNVGGGQEGVQLGDRVEWAGRAAFLSLVPRNKELPGEELGMLWPELCSQIHMWEPQSPLWLHLNTGLLWR